VFGGLALRAASDGKVRCVMTTSGGLVCPSANEPAVNRARTMQTGANAAFIAGGIVAAVGVVLVIVRPGGRSGATARLVPGVGSVMLEGGF